MGDCLWQFSTAAGGLLINWATLSLKMKRSLKRKGKKINISI